MLMYFRSVQSKPFPEVVPLVIFPEHWNSFLSSDLCRYEVRNQNWAQWDPINWWIWIRLVVFCLWTSCPCSYYICIFVISHLKRECTVTASRADYSHKNSICVWVVQENISGPTYQVSVVSLNKTNWMNWEILYVNILNEESWMRICWWTDTRLTCKNVNYRKRDIEKKSV